MRATRALQPFCALGLEILPCLVHPSNPALPHAPLQPCPASCTPPSLPCLAHPSNPALPRAPLHPCLPCLAHPSNPALPRAPLHPCPASCILPILPYLMPPSKSDLPCAPLQPCPFLCASTPLCALCHRCPARPRRPANAHTTLAPSNRGRHPTQNRKAADRSLPPCSTGRGWRSHADAPKLIPIDLRGSLIPASPQGSQAPQPEPPPTTQHTSSGIPMHPSPQHTSSGTHMHP